MFEKAFDKKFLGEVKQVVAQEHPERKLEEDQILKQNIDDDFEADIDLGEIKK